MAGQNWQVGICQAYPRRVQPYSGDTYIGIQKSTWASYFGRVTEDLAGSIKPEYKIQEIKSRIRILACSKEPENSYLRFLLSSMSLTIRRTPRTAQGFQEPLLDVSNALPLHMVLIPSGIFVMGSPETELEREQCESPQHEVVVPSFLMGRYPVTQAQYVQVMQTNPAENYDKNRFVAPNKPVVGVTWHEAVEFCDRLADLTGRAYRLPTEAEWEYACRAGTKTPFYFGKTVTTEVANYDGNYVYSDGSQGDYRQATTPVDQFGIANAFGLSDMHGNVWEWCQDSWHDDYNGAPANGSAWLEEEKSSNRVLRGGSWFNNPWPCRSAFRFVFNPEDRSNRFGFRVSCSAPRIL